MLCTYTCMNYNYPYLAWPRDFLDGYCSTVQGLLDWCVVDLELCLFRLMFVLYVMYVYVITFSLLGQGIGGGICP